MTTIEISFPVALFIAVLILILLVLLFERARAGDRMAVMVMQYTERAWGAVPFEQLERWEDMKKAAAAQTPTKIDDVGWEFVDKVTDAIKETGDKAFKKSVSQFAHEAESWDPSKEESWDPSKAESWDPSKAESWDPSKGEAPHGK